MTINVYSLNAGQLDELTVNMESGLTKLAATLKLTQITPTELADQLAAFLPVDADFNAERTKRQVLSTNVQTAQDDFLSWLAAVKTAISSSYGQRWSAEWIAVGFITPSLEIPAKRGQQASLGLGMVSFLTKNPTFEVSKSNVTAAYGQALLDAVTNTKKLLKDEEAIFNALSAQWDTVYNALTDSLWSLIKILQASLKDNDPRWLDFGLPLPSTPSTPAKPVGLVAQLNHADGSIGVSCPAVALATRYRWRMRFVGVQSDYTLAASSVDPMAAIAGVLPGQAVEIIAQAVNGNLQSVASDPILFTMPLTLPTPPAAPAARAESAEGAQGAEGAPVYRNAGSSYTNGNGHARL